MKKRKNEQDNSPAKKSKTKETTHNGSAQPMTDGSAQPMADGSANGNEQQSSKSPNPQSAQVSLGAKLEMIRSQVEERFDAIIDLVSEVSVPEALKELNEQREQLNDLLDCAPHHRIGFIGPRGAGKTTLLNKLLGIKEIFPTGSDASTTAVISEAIGWQEKKFRADIYFMKDTEWCEFVSKARNELEQSREKAKAKNTTWTFTWGDKTNQKYSEMLDLYLRALWEYSDSDDPGLCDITDGYFEWEKKANPIELIPVPFRAYLRNAQFFRFENENKDAFTKELTRYTHRDHPLWPLVVKVTVYGPFEKLVNGEFSVVDIPGCGDGDEALTDTFQKGQILCESLFYVPFQKTLFTHETVKKITDHAHTHHLGIIVNHFKKYKPTGNLEEWFRTRMLKKARYGEREIIRKVPVYFMENNPEKPDKYSHLFDEFVAAVSQRVRDHTEALIQSYVEQANYILNAIKKLFSLDDEKLRSVINLVNSKFTPLEDVQDIQDPTHFSDWLEKGALKPNDYEDVMILAPGTHTWTLRQMLDKKEGSKRMQLIKALIHPLITIELDRLEGICQRICQSYRDYIVGELVAGLGVISNDFKDIVTALRNWKPRVVYLKKYVMNEAFEEANRRHDTELRGLLSRKRKVMLNNIDTWWKEHADALAADFRRDVHVAAKKFIVITLQKFQEKLTLIEKLNRNEGIRTIAALDKLLTPITSDPTTNQLIPLPSLPKPTHCPLPSSPWNDLQQYITQNPEFLTPLNVRLMDRTDQQGVVYVLYNPVYGPGLFKIGHTTCKTSQQRADELYKSGVPAKFIVVHEWKTNRASSFEKVMHSIFALVRENKKREFFRAPLNFIVEAGDRVQQIFVLIGDKQLSGELEFDGYRRKSKSSATSVR